jgi:hypothetical protein
MQMYEGKIFMIMVETHILIFKHWNEEPVTDVAI